MPRVTVKGLPLTLNIGGGEYGLGTAVRGRASPFTVDDRREIGRFIHEVVDRLGSIPFFSLDSDLKRCVGHLAGAALGRLSALGLLVENGRDGEAGALARALIEWEISVARLCLAPSKEQADLVERFKAFEIAQHRKVFLRIGSQDANREMRSMTEMYPDPGLAHDNAVRLEAAFRDACARYPDLGKWQSWTNARIPAVIDRIRDDAVRQALERKYRVWFPILSEFNHPSSSAAAGGMTSFLGVLAAKPMPYMASECVANMYSMTATLGGVAAPKIDDLLASYSNRLSNVLVHLEAEYHCITTDRLETVSHLKRFLAGELIRRVL